MSTANSRWLISWENNFPIQRWFSRSRWWIATKFLGRNREECETMPQPRREIPFSFVMNRNYFSTLLFVYMRPAWVCLHGLHPSLLPKNKPKKTRRRWDVAQKHNKNLMLFPSSKSSFLMIKNVLCPFSHHRNGSWSIILALLRLCEGSPYTLKVLKSVTGVSVCLCLHECEHETSTQAQFMLVVGQRQFSISLLDFSITLNVITRGSAYRFVAFFPTFARNFSHLSTRSNLVSYVRQ